MIELKRINGSMVTPKDDALLFDYLFSGSGIFEGVEVTHLGANQLLVTDGRGMILGRDFCSGRRNNSRAALPIWNSARAALSANRHGKHRNPDCDCYSNWRSLAGISARGHQQGWHNLRVGDCGVRRNGNCKSAILCVSHPISQKLKC